MAGSAGASDTPPEVAIQPVSRTRAHEDVARQLQELIRRGELPGGRQLPPERELAGRFRVSRATLRQALSELRANGLVDSRVGEGTFVRADAGEGGTNVAAALRGAQASLGDQLGLRRLVEPQVAQLAAEHAQGHDLDTLDHYVVLQQRRMAGGLPFVDEDSAFHLAIARATDNALLAKMVEGIHELLRESREHSQRAPGGMQRSLDGHHAILDAIRRGDGEAAYSAMLAHIQDVENLSLSSLDRPHPGQ